MTGRKSPFEWFSTIMDRSQSRQDQMSQVETGSIRSIRPASRATTGRKELLHATPTLTPEKAKEPVTKTWELTIPSPTPSPSPLGPNRSTNFSRSFSNRAPSSPLTQRSEFTLSRISERSPHQSMISTTGPIHPSQNRSSHHSAINPLDSTTLAGQMPQPSPSTPRKSMTLAVPPPRSRPKNPHPIQPQDPRASDSVRSSSIKQNRDNISSDAAPRLSLPKPVALSMSPAASRTNLTGVPSPRTNSFYRQPNPSRLDLAHSSHNSDSTSPSASSTHLSRKSSSSIGPSGVFYERQLPRSRSETEYWSSRTDLQDVSSQRKRQPWYASPGAFEESKLGPESTPGLSSRAGRRANQREYNGDPHSARKAQQQGSTEEVPEENAGSQLTGLTEHVTPDWWLPGANL